MGLKMIALSTLIVSFISPVIFSGVKCSDVNLGGIYRLDITEAGKKITKEEFQKLNGQLYRIHQIRHLPEKVFRITAVISNDILPHIVINGKGYEEIHPGLIQTPRGNYPMMTLQDRTVKENETEEPNCAFGFYDIGADDWEYMMLSAYDSTSGNITLGYGEKKLTPQTAVLTKVN